MSENMASSTSFGSRPSRSTIRAYSSRVRPSSTARAAWSGNGGAVKGLEELETIGAARQRIDRVLGVRHQTEDVAGRVADAGDVVLRAVGVLPRRVAENDLLRGEYTGWGVVAACRVLDRDRQALAWHTRAREGGVRVDDIDIDL